MRAVLPNGDRKFLSETDRENPFVLGRMSESGGVPAQAKDRAWGLNKERADPALIICLITAAYEGFQTP